MILLIDNYDSFSYNLYQLIGAFNPHIKVARNDELSLEQIERAAPSHIFLSPGPGKPSKAGICEDAVRHFAKTVPIFGVCLGHQAICEVYGATVTYANKLTHGKASLITLDTKSPLFRDMPNNIKAARYHSLAALASTIPPSLKIIAQTQDGEVMAVSHREYRVCGVQFHPESILTPEGYKIVENFLKVA